MQPKASAQDDDDDVVDSVKDDEDDWMFKTFDKAKSKPFKQEQTH